MFLLYNFLLLLLLPVVLLITLRKEGKRERLGIISPLSPESRGVWIHAVSVGEVVASEPLVSLLKEKHPEIKIYYSTTTPTGRKMAEKILASKLDYLFYFPLDYPWIISHVLYLLRPRFIVLMETELWPNLLYYAQLHRIPVFVANGRLSPQSFKRCRRLQFLFRPILNKVSLFLLQSEEEKKKFLSLGVSSEKLKVVGNTKFDRLPQALPSFSKLAREWERERRNPVWVVGSTHPGEEEAILYAFQEVRKFFPSSLLILVPRHPERKREIENLLQKFKFLYMLRSEMKEGPKDAHVVLVDTVGELFLLYSLADITFIGGTLVPIGGHNPLEPAVFSKPIIFGPHTFNFQDIFQMMHEEGIGIRVKDGKELQQILPQLLEKKEELKKMGKKARTFVENNRGAAERIIREIESRVLCVE